MTIGLLPTQSKTPKNIETLRFIYAETQSDLERERSRAETRTRTLATLPATAGAVLALFIAVRPDSDSTLVSTLYAIGLVPFVLIVVMSIAATGPLSEIRLSGAPPPGENIEDVPPETEWLTQRISENRMRLSISPTLAVTARLRERVLVRLQVLFAVEVIYLVALTIIAPFID